MKLLAISILLVCIGQLSCTFNIDPDEKRSFAELVASRGFFLQEHKVTTEDGYILTLHRVVPQNYSAVDYSKTRKPVIAFHGIMCASPIFFMSSPFLTTPDSKCGDNFGFGMVLNKNYDLWVPNARGNGISMEHVNLTTLNPNFWKFTWDDIALKDIPAILKYVLQETGHKTVGWVGYSQGGGTLMALLSLKPEYGQYIRPFIGWAAGALFGGSKSPAFKASQLLRPLLQLVPGELSVTGPYLNVLQQYGCRPELGLNLICNTVYESFMGPSVSLNKSRIPVYGRFFPSLSSNQQSAQSLQNDHYGRFMRFEYTLPSDNQAKYGATKAPDYPLKNVPKNVPITLMYGLADWLVDPTDTLKLTTILKLNGVDVTARQVPTPVWTHFDYITGQGAGRLVYDPTIALLDKYVVQDGPK